MLDMGQQKFALLEKGALIIKAGKYFCIMSDTLIKKFTLEQEDLIPVYAQKWASLVFSTEPIDRQKAAEAVKAVYAAIEKEEPEILFLNSPYAVLNAFQFQWRVYLVMTCGIGC